MVQTYKRNQVEEAVALTLGATSAEHTRTVKSRIKRLLDLDRRRGRNLRARDPEDNTYAFFSEEAPGSGSEIMFSDYEAFALLQALRMMNHNWPQDAGITILRTARTDLERCHSHILKSDPAKLFDPGLIRQRNANGNYEATNADPHFLLVVSDAKIREGKRDIPYSKVFRGEIEAFKFMHREPGRSSTWFELVGPAWTLHKHLEQTNPSRRGRGR